ITASLVLTTDRVRYSFVELYAMKPRFPSTLVLIRQFPNSVRFDEKFALNFGNCVPMYSLVSETTATFFATSTDLTRRVKKDESAYPLLNRDCVPNAGTPPRSVSSLCSVLMLRPTSHALRPQLSNCEVMPASRPRFV